jgi:peptidoglycan/xylan/chitin deacetylase (PgdA/CDA1 family)
VSGRRLLRRSAAAAARGRGFAWLVDALERASRPQPGVLAVLTYHRVDDPARSPDLYPGLISATPSEFEDQMRFLASRYHALSLDELLAVRRGAARLPVRSVVVTFDDGYRDFADEAWPILERHGIPVVLFVPTAYAGDPARAFWWDRVYGALSSATPAQPVETPVGALRLASTSDRLVAFRRVRSRVQSLPHPEAMAFVDDFCDALGAAPARSTVLDWTELRRLRSEGVALAPHSRTHPLLDRLSPEAAREEILGSADDLVREVGDADRVFAYPGGGESPEVGRVLADEGFELAFTTERGTNDVHATNWLRLRRINVGPASGLTLIRAQLLPWWARMSRQEGGSRTANTLEPSQTVSRR